MMTKRMKIIKDEKSLYKLQIPVIGMINASDLNKLKHVNTIIISSVRKICLVVRCPEYGANISGSKMS